MYQIDEIQIIQDIASKVIPLAESGWSELMITYYAEENVSDFSSSYLVNEKEKVKEKPLLVDHNVRGLLRTLQECIARGGKQKFSSCRLHFWSSGKFETNYGYEKVDWDGLIYVSSNFFPASKA